MCRMCSPGLLPTDNLHVGGLGRTDSSAQKLIRSTVQSAQKLIRSTVQSAIQEIKIKK